MGYMKYLFFVVVLLACIMLDAKQDVRFGGNRDVRRAGRGIKRDIKNRSGCNSLAPKSDCPVNPPPPSASDCPVNPPPTFEG